MNLSIKADFDVPNSLSVAIAGLALTLAVSSAGAASNCPNVITTPAGSAFDLASLISDNGSPEAALTRLRSSLTRLDDGARCKMLRDVHACDETVELAKRAVVALEACSARTPREKRAPGIDTRKS
ncbi:MAG TPA: hypothetical protein VF573_20815 [Paraburkholderia sp.]|uniref:hypothetical protein n=1 Tax=Paraburkholderia sp. TaxID=1926495 RepID=UPI002ED37243